MKWVLLALTCCICSSQVTAQTGKGADEVPVIVEGSYQVEPITSKSADVLRVGKLKVDRVLKNVLTDYSLKEGDIVEAEDVSYSSYPYLGDPRRPRTPSSEKQIFFVNPQKSRPPRIFSATQNERLDIWNQIEQFRSDNLGATTQRYTLDAWYGSPRVSLPKNQPEPKPRPAVWPTTTVQVVQMAYDACPSKVKERFRNAYSINSASSHLMGRVREVSALGQGNQTLINEIWRSGLWGIWDSYVAQLVAMKIAREADPALAKMDAAARRAFEEIHLASSEHEYGTLDIILANASKSFVGKHDDLSLADPVFRCDPEIAERKISYSLRTPSVESFIRVVTDLSQCDVVWASSEQSGGGTKYYLLFTRSVLND